MTVASEITRLQTAKADARTSIINKWVDVPANATLDTYHTYIDMIQQGWELGSVIEYIRDKWYVQLNMKKEEYRTYHNNYDWNISVPNARVFNWWTVLAYTVDYQHNSAWGMNYEARAWGYKNWVFKFIYAHSWQNYNTNSWYWGTTPDWKLWSRYLNNYWSTYYCFDFDAYNDWDRVYDTWWYDEAPEWYVENCSRGNWTISADIDSWWVTVHWKMDYNQSQWSTVLWYAN